MPLLGLQKPDVDAQLGKSVMARNVLDLSQAGEKAFSYGLGDFDVIVGFLGGISRYNAVVRRKGPLKSLSQSELAAGLALNAPASLWTAQSADSEDEKKPAKKSPPKPVRVAPTQYFTFVERDPKLKHRVLREFHGWMPGGKPYAFFYQPAMDGQSAILVSEWGVNQALG